MRDARHLRAWMQDRAVADRRRAAALRARLPSVVELLVDRFGATRVVLFGSLARGEAGPHSDVDLLVEGLPDERVFEASGAVQMAVPDAVVDLAPAQHVRPAIRERAEAEGEVLHG